ncbi:WD40 repeat-like protein [Rhizoclosmatium globosum]|uniref:Elongator complex protein 2 n=1 Tax=Rhizoclosmatium globosum TaxID=329046 RepID=A0A1Y2CVJ8_9FUNG|nr:WD40 repeat-like protein [Rhizoclosmatium globosum]|eukprot:ORY51042.1 WD40 repeat-like protein [Rhizoclosmatium globosum]
MPLLIAASTNRSAQATAASPCGRYSVFATHNSIGVVDLKLRKTTSTIAAHQNTVAALKFADENTLVSAAADASICTWGQGFQGPHCPVNALATLGDLIVSASTDASLRVWSIKGGDCVQVIQTGPKYALACSLTYMPHSKIPVLFTGGCDGLLTVYVWDSATSQFVKKLALQGHTDWIRDIDTAIYSSAATNSIADGGLKDGDLMVASASQDKYVDSGNYTGGMVGAENPVPDAKNQGDTDFKDAIEMLEALVAHILDVDGKKYTIMFDALLIGHEDWVHSVQWAQPEVSVTGTKYQPLRLITASADKSVTVWTPDSHHIWTVDARLGEVGGLLFWFLRRPFPLSHNSQILAHGYHGAIQFWEKSQRQSCGLHLLGYQDIWRCKGLAWSPKGDFLLSTSLDQTTRLWAPWIHSGQPTVSWHELARPQIHGYDLHCLAMVHGYGFVAGADEKVVRVFEASRTFLEGLEGVSGVKEGDAEVVKRLPVGAAVPALGLSNKAILPGAPIDTNAQLIFEPLAPDLTTPTEPPLEQYLMQHTLWPEVNKLYGHGFELISLAASHSGTHIASSSKATSPEHAVVRVWSTETWKESQPPLVAHSLTVTTIQFSYSGEFILTAGRDRMWVLWKPHVRNVAHGRIVWCVSWTYDDLLFATASRDKTIKIWSVKDVEGSAEAAVTVKCECAATAVAFAPWVEEGGGYLMAVGLEDGRVVIYKMTNSCSRVLAQEVRVLEDSPGAVVTKMAWRPRKNGSEETVLAVASEDYSVRIFQL